MSGPSRKRRLCLACNRMLGFKKFHKHPEGKFGRASKCIACFNTAYGIGSAVQAKRRRILYVRGWLRHAVGVAKARARTQGVPFNITEDHLTIPARCPVLGIRLFFTKGKKTPNTPSLDRKKPKRGYVRENVTVISWRANRLKMNETNPKVFLRIAKYLEGK
jgi:hypothetical protein